MLRLKRAAVIAAAPLFSACATAFGGYDRAPNGLTRDEAELRRAIAFAAEQAYTRVTEGEYPLPDDDLLRLLYAGTAGRYAGHHQESAHYLDLASYLAEDRVTRSLSREALSMVTSDRALAYTPGRTELLMIHYHAALDFLAAGDADGAAVEARRIEALLDRLEEGTVPEDQSADARFLHYFAGTLFDAAGDWTAADVAYRRAGDLSATLGTGTALGDSLGDVVLLIERGFVPHRVEQSVVIVLPPTQVKALTDGSAGERAVAAGAAAARILLTAAAVYGERHGYYRDGGYRRQLRLEPWPDCGDRRYAGNGAHACDDDDDEAEAEAEDEDVNPYLLRISWPVLYDDAEPVRPVRVRAGDIVVEAGAAFDLARATERDFDAERAAMLARTVARAAAKVALSVSLESSVSKKDEGAGKLLGMLTNIGTLLTERADTRSWHLLPGSVSLVRLRLPPGTHDLSFDAGTFGSGRDLGRVEVQPGRTTVLATRIWQ